MSWPSSSAQLVGRDQDLAVVRAFVDQAARDGGSLVVSGDAGVGKTALIEAAAAYAAAAGLRASRAALRDALADLTEADGNDPTMRD